MSSRSTLRTSAASKASRQRRAGSTSMMFVMTMLIGVSALIVVINWLYLLMAVQRTTQLTDIIALSAASELLDEGLLQDAQIVNAVTNQGVSGHDDRGEVERAVTAFRLANNQATASRLQLAAEDMRVTPGYVADVTSPITGKTFVESPADGLLYNALRLDVTRQPGGVNPLLLLIRAFRGPEAVKVTTSAYAVLDNRVVGFRPTAGTAVPVVPLAIEAEAWFGRRPSQGIDAYPSAGNGRLEMDICLAASQIGGLSNGALVGLDADRLDRTVLAAQIEFGITPGDLPAGEEVIGPASPVQPWLVPASVTSPSNDAGQVDTDALVAAFNRVAADRDSRRVFPLYEGPFSNPLKVTGWVAANVLHADNSSVPGDDRLTVTIEPVFIVHSAAVTDPALPDYAVNTYIHKLRLSR